MININALSTTAVQLEDLAIHLGAMNLNIVASAVLLFWDILLRFDREVKYIWKFKFSLVTVLFGVVRMLTVGEIILLLIRVFSVTDSACKRTLWIESLVGLLLSTGSDILLILRVYAFYGRNKLLLTFLCVLEAITFVTVFCTIMIVTPQIQVISNPFPRQLLFGGCILSDATKLLSYVWIPILCVQTMLFGLAAGRHLHLQRKSWLMISRLYYTFMQDGVWCFLVLFVINLLCIIEFEVNTLLGSICFYWCFPLIGICTSRLILNLRSASDLQDYSLEISLR